MLCEDFVIFSPFVSCFTKFTTKPGPLSDPMEMEIPHVGIIFFNKTWSTFWAFSLWVGKASTYPEKVHIITRRYLPFPSEIIISFFYICSPMYMKSGKSIFRVCVYIKIFPAASWRASVSAMSSSFCVYVPGAVPELLRLRHNWMWDPPSVSFCLPLTSKAVAARACRQGGHLLVTESSCLDG
jgi:hypothetical protein